MCYEKPKLIALCLASDGIHDIPGDGDTFKAYMFHETIAPHDGRNTDLTGNTSSTAGAYQADE
jgi:hypothetical protein